MTAIELRGINKSFGPVHANKNVALSIEKGTIHGIIGENGAGKSTLMSILYGFYEADSGDVLINGTVTKIRSSNEAIAAGIGMVHQHFMLVDPFSVLENVMLGAEGGALLNRGIDTAREELERLEREYGLDVPVDALAGELPVGLQQRVEILKALYRGAEILILDEPTGVLTPQETDQLFRILKALKDQGVTVVLITHKLQEIMAVTDGVSVMRGGEMVAHRKTSETSKEELAELMVGRKVLLKVDKDEAQPDATALNVEGLSVISADGVPRVDNVSFSVRRGEIVGIAGVSGNGQSELLEALSGIVAPSKGKIEIDGTTITSEHRLDAREIRGLGVAHVPEDRHRMGLVTAFTADESAILGYHNSDAYNGRILMNRKAITEDCAEKMAAYDVRPPTPSLKSANFSGGNQQKIVLAREMARKPVVLLVGQPTRGVDIGAIEYIHKNLVAMRDAGSAVLLVSVELEEIMSLSDRILVMFEGRIVGEVDAKDADERMLGLMMANAGPEADAQMRETEAAASETSGLGAEA